jgi:hypothetical protein
MSLVRLARCTTLACGCVVGRYAKWLRAANWRMSRKGTSLRKSRPSAQPHRGDRAYGDRLSYQHSQSFVTDRRLAGTADAKPTTKPAFSRSSASF